MRNYFLRKLFSAFIALIVVLIGFFYSSHSDKQTAKTLVKGQLDLLLKGQVSEKYRNILADKPSSTSLKSNYETNIQDEVNLFFQNYALSETYKVAHKAELTQDFKKLLSSAKYKVGKLEKNGNTYSVLITLEPCTIFKKLNEDYSKIAKDIENEINSGKFKDANHSAIDGELTKRFIPKFKEYLQKIEYEPGKIVSIRVVEDKDNYLNLNSEDLVSFIEEILPYQ